MTDQQSQGINVVPRVVFAQRVIDKIVKGALLYPGTETGEALIGLIVPQDGRSEPDIYVLDTIGPGEHAVREWGMFEQGDDWQGDVLHWLHVNWEALRKLRGSSTGDALAEKWNVPLVHVGDWHKQPGDMIAPSGGDAETARLMIADAETSLQYIVAPIVTMYPLRGDMDSPAEEASVPPTAEAPVSDTGHSEKSTMADAALTEAEEDGGDSDATSEVETAANTAAESEPTIMQRPAEAALPEADTPIRSRRGSMPEEEPNTIIHKLQAEGWIVRIDCWYMSQHVQQFVAVSPEIWADDRLPALPPIAWHLVYPRRFDQEYKLLVDAGYMVDVVRWDADGRPPYEICFSVYKHGSSRVILFVTSVDYPAEMPAIRLAPLVPVDDDEDVFTKLYEASEPVLMTDLPDWEWDSKRTLIELVWHIEQVLAKREKQEKQVGGAE